MYKWFKRLPFDIFNFTYLLLIGTIFECEAGASESVGNLVDPCYFPTPHYPNFPGLCQYNYHKLGFVCDPLALLSRTEAELLNKRFENLSLSGCVDCKNTIRRGCVPENESSVRVSLLIVPYTNTQRIEACVVGRFRNSHYTAAEAARAYAEMVQRNWAESGCGSDITILYIGKMHNPLTNIRQPNPFVVRLFNNNLAHLSTQMSSVKMVSAERGLFESLYLELNHSLSLAHIDNRFVGTPKPNQKPNHFGGVPLWAFETCAILLVLVLVTLYLGNCVVRRFDTRSQKKPNARAALLSTQSSNNAVNGANDRWRAGFGGGLVSANSSSAANQNTSLSSNLAIQNTKSSMMFRQFSAHASKKQQDRAKATIQKI